MMRPLVPDAALFATRHDVLRRAPVLCVVCAVLRLSVISTEAASTPFLALLV